MTDLQIINKILNTGNFAIASQNGLDTTYFPNYEREFKFIADHYGRFGRVPDKATFLGQFPDFQLMDVSEPDQYLVEGITEEYVYNKSLPILREVERLLRDRQSVRAVEYLSAKLPSLTCRTALNATDIVRNAEARVAELEKRATGDFFITTGFAELDKALMGWQRGEDLVTIMGRTNEGKTWILLKFLEEAWRSGRRVGLYSGEMSTTQVGFRFDTIYRNFSNALLARGTQEIGYYRSYAEALRDRNSFFVITPEDMGGSATVTKLNAFIEKYELDILGVDQYSLMDDESYQRNMPLRAKYDNISKGLFLSSCKYHIPILAAVQANRKASEKSFDKATQSSVSDGPRLEHISESDAIAHNSSRVLAIKQKDGNLEIEIVKNRLGGRNGKFLYRWLIDTGKFDYVPTTENVSDRQKVEEQRRRFKDRDNVF